jgi:hypothetical protein
MHLHKQAIHEIENIIKQNQETTEAFSSEIIELRIGSFDDFWLNPFPIKIFRDTFSNTQEQTIYFF